jgi:lactoylglutathione lyase
MQQIQRVNHIGLRVSNFNTAKAFYQKLGFAYIAGPTGPEPVAIVEHPSGININFVLNANQDEKRNMLMEADTKYTGYTHVALEVSDLNSVIAELAENNIPLSGEAMQHPTGTSCFIRDPDDNVIEFVEYIGRDAFTDHH